MNIFIYQIIKFPTSSLPRRAVRNNESANKIGATSVRLIVRILQICLQFDELFVGKRFVTIWSLLVMLFVMKLCFIFCIFGLCFAVGWMVDLSFFFINRLRVLTRMGWFGFFFSKDAKHLFSLNPQCTSEISQGKSFCSFYSFLMIIKMILFLKRFFLYL